MEKRIEISILLDFYGELLTEKQRDIMILYYNDDLSLAEISEITNTTRQAIHDINKRCYNLLINYEDKLKLMEKNMVMIKTKENLLCRLEELKKYIDSSSNFYRVDEIKNDITENI
jgi:predicted DNA-binding protein YlxM (UPF0122 family)